MRASPQFPRLWSWLSNDLALRMLLLGISRQCFPLAAMHIAKSPASSWPLLDKPMCKSHHSGADLLGSLGAGSTLDAALAGARTQLRHGHMQMNERDRMRSWNSNAFW